MALLTIADFADKTNQVFTMAAGDDSVVQFTLTSVKPSTYGSPPNAERSAFSLFFDGTKGQPFPQGTYPLQHPVMGTLDIFLVPVAKNDDETYTYQAVFN